MEATDSLWRPLKRKAERKRSVVEILGSSSVSMETLTSTWSPIDQCDVTNVGEKRHSSPRGWECVFSRSPPAGGLWSEQFSPHLQRNKQLEETLLQREEELSRLQEENDKLRKFLNSPFVRNLGDKSKRLSSDRTRNVNRKRPYHVGSFQNSSGHHLQVSKRVCRNLSAEFSSTESSLSSYDPTLDLWVLKTLGLKDPDTIDTSSLPTAYQQNLAVSPVAGQIQSDRSDCSYGTAGPQSPLALTTSTPNHTSPPSGPQFSEGTHFSQSPVQNWTWTPQSRSQFGHCEGGHSDLAFAMSLSPATSVKTLSYPQGQAFVRRDPQGRCNFTWLPTHTPPETRTQEVDFRRA
ncbi:geminin coiled-coil domain-containing protein 1 isoform X2 [Vanacampus margaritifer]